MTEMTSARYFVSPGDIQQNIVRSAKAQVAAYAFFRITDPQKFRDFVRSRTGAAAGSTQGARALAEAASLLDVLKAPEARILPHPTSEKPRPASFPIARARNRRPASRSPSPGRASGSWAWTR